MKTSRYIAGISGIALGAGLLWFAAKLRGIASGTGIFSSEDGNPKTFSAIFIVLGVALIILAYDFGFRKRRA